MANYDSKYYKNNEQSGDRRALDFYYKLFKKELGEYGGKKKVLEYGCGVGHLTKRLAKDFDCFALDISDYALKQVKKNAPKAKTIKKLTGIANKSLDGIIALHVMEHLDDPKVTLHDFGEKLKPGGLLLFVVPNPTGIGAKIKKNDWFGYSDKTHVALFIEKHWRQITEDSGFVVLKVKGDGMWDVPYIRFVPNIIQKLLFFPPAAIQVLTKRLFLPTRFGECLIVYAHKK